MMGSKCVQSFLDSLDEDVGPHDYDILFGGARRHQPRSKRSEELFKAKLFASVSPDIESEVIQEYFSSDTKGEVDNLDVTTDFVVATQIDLQAKKKQCQEAELISKWSSHCQDSTVLEPEKLIQLVSLPDNIFQSVISTADMSIDILKKVVSTSCETPNVSKDKLAILAQYALLPKFCEANIPSRTVVPIYKQLLTSTLSTTMMNCVLLPMFKMGVTIPRPLYASIDKELFFNSAINWLDEEHMELTSTLASTLNQLFDQLKYIDEQSHDTIVMVLERSVRYRPDDNDVAHFFWLVVNKFGDVMSEDNLKKLQTLNYANETKNQRKIQVDIDKHLGNFSTA